MARKDITTFGAVSGSDSTTAFQAAVDEANSEGGGEVFIPNGEFLIDKVQATSGILVKSNVHILGEDPERAILKVLDDNYTGDFYMLYADGVSNVVFRNFKIDGNFDLMDTADEQTHAIQIESTEDVVIDNMRFFNTFGDGIKLLGQVGADNKRVRISNCDFLHSNRSGVAFQRNNFDTIVEHCTFSDIRNSSVDWEPTGAGINKTILRDLIMDHSMTKGVGFTIDGGTNSNDLVMEDIVLIDSQLLMLNMKDVVCRGLKLNAKDVTPALSITRGMENMTFDNCEFTSTGVIQCVNIVEVAGSFPTNITFTECKIISDNTGVLMEGGKQITLLRCEVIATAPTVANGIHFKATDPSEDCEVRDSRIERYDQCIRFNASSADLDGAVAVNNRLVFNNGGVGVEVLETGGSVLNQNITGNNEIELPA